MRFPAHGCLRTQFCPTLNQVVCFQLSWSVSLSCSVQSATLICLAQNRPTHESDNPINHPSRMVEGIGGPSTRPTCSPITGRSQDTAETESNRLELNQSQQDGHGETSLSSPGEFVRRELIDQSLPGSISLRGRRNAPPRSLFSRAISRDGTDLARFAVAGALRRLIRVADAGL